MKINVVEYMGKDDDGNDLYVIAVPPKPKWDGNPSESSVKIAHDYVEFYANTYFNINRDVERPSYQNSNTLCVPVSIQLGINEMHNIILPLLNKSSYLKDSHFIDKENNLTRYIYHGEIVRYYNDGQPTVSFRRNGESVWETVTQNTFNLIKPTLALCYRKDSVEEFFSKNK